MIKRYRVTGKLEFDYDDILAENEDDAFLQASDAAVSGGDWDYDVEEVEGSLEIEGYDE